VDFRQRIQTPPIMLACTHCTLPQHRVSGAQGFWSTGFLEHRVSGAQGFWSTGFLEHRVSGAQGFWSTGVLEHRVSGAQGFYGTQCKTSLSTHQRGSWSFVPSPSTQYFLSCCNVPSISSKSRNRSSKRTHSPSFFRTANPTGR
jgi:hypothetical protein